MQGSSVGGVIPPRYVLHTIPAGPRLCSERHTHAVLVRGPGPVETSLRFRSWNDHAISVWCPPSTRPPLVRQAAEPLSASGQCHGCSRDILGRIQGLKLLSLGALCKIPFSMKGDDLHRTRDPHMPDLDCMSPISPQPSCRILASYLGPGWLSAMGDHSETK